MGNVGIMKRFATSIILAGGLFAGLLGAAGAAHATGLHSSPGAGTTDFGGTIGLDAADDSLPLGMGDTSVGGAGTSAPFVIAGGGISFG